MTSVRFKFLTGATSASQLFAGRGRPKFFSLLTAQIASAVDMLNVDFNALYKDREFRRAMQNAFEEFKKWFFETAVNKFCIQKGDLFSITIDAEVDVDVRTIKFYYETADVVVWRRLTSPCGEPGECEKKLKDCEKELFGCKEKIENLRSLLK